MTRQSLLPLSLLLAAALAAPLAASDCGDDPAVQAMEKAVKADSKNATNNYNLAAAYYNKQCYDQAIDAFERTAKLVKGEGPAQEDMRFECYSALGGLYYQTRQDAGSAVKYFKQALDIRPRDKDSLNGLSLAYMKLGKTEEASQYLDQTIAADPRNVEARYRKAVLLNGQLEDQKKPAPELRKQVITAFSEAADKAEAYGAKDNAQILVVCYTRLGELYRDTDQAAKAVDVLTKAVKLAPDDFNSHFILGQMYYKQNNFASMVEQYKKAVEIDPKQKLARFNLGVAFINQEQYYEAWEQFKAITELDSGDSEALALMGQTLERAVDQQLSQGAAHYTADELADAKACFEKVLAMDGKSKTAKDYLAKVDAKIDKDFSDLVSKAKAFLKKKKNEDAAEALERALALKPDDAEAKDLSTKTHANIGKLVKRYLAAGDKAFTHGDYETAEASWSRARGFSAGRKQAEVKLAKLNKLMSVKLDHAFKRAKAALAKKDPDLLTARNAYREALSVAKNDPKATNGLSQVNAKISDRVKKLVDSGKANFEKGERDKAKSAFNKALKLDPTNADANSYIARMTGGESKAKVDAEKVKALYYQGVDLYVNNKIKEAIATWKELLKLDPNHQDAQKNIVRAEAKLKALANL